MKNKVHPLKYDEKSNSFKIRELEVSITSKCHLRCNNCGFYVPEQPNPSKTNNMINEIANGLLQFQRLNIQIESLAILGGEPTYDKILLNETLSAIKNFDNILQIELVTHGLTPQNISPESLRLIDKLTISVYFNSKELIGLWKDYIKLFAPHIELSLRTDTGWDKWSDKLEVADKMAQEMYDNCWYRKHCVTLERERLFICSRIAKLSHDREGILLNSKTELADIQNYLNGETFFNSCKSCTPMMGLPLIKAGQQPDERISKMIPKAINFLKSRVDE